MATNKRSTAASAQQSTMLFLASHGFQTPISAIRWGCGRLRKMQGLDDESRKLVENIGRQAKILAHMFEALLVLAKVEDGVHKPRMQDVYLHDFFATSAGLDELGDEVQASVTCPDTIRLRVDRPVFEALLQAVLIVVATAAEGKRPLAIHASVDEASETCTIRLTAPLTLSLVAQESDDDSPARSIVGGIPGLMLSVASSLAQGLGGDLVIQQEEPSSLTVHLPAPRSVSVLE